MRDIILRAVGGLSTAALFGGVMVSTAQINSSNVVTQESNTVTTQAVERREPVITKETVTESEKVSFSTEYVDDGNLAQGTTKIVQEGTDGEKTKYYEVTYEDGLETSRRLVKTEIVREPVDEVIARGTYVAPAPVSASAPAATASAPAQSTVQACANGTYVNAAGNTVCRPSNDPAGATALCKDGSYSDSQSRQGTCSHHGGVKRWL